jgi:hypothetical protein
MRQCGEELRKDSPVDFIDKFDGMDEKKRREE